MSRFKSGCRRFGDVPSYLYPPRPHRRGIEIIFLYLICMLVVFFEFGDVPKLVKEPVSKAGRSGNRRGGSNPSISAYGPVAQSEDASGLSPVK